jgi:KamA family protein
MEHVPASWQRELSEAVTCPRELLALLGLPASMADAAQRAGEAFSLRVTRSFIARMRPGDANDPLLRQVLPVGDELVEVAGYGPDPLEEGAARRAPQLLHKYTGRALLIATEACAIHCRYCFRREFPYSVPGAPRAAAGGAKHSTSSRGSSIEEVILSGGDPLSLSDARPHAAHRRAGEDSAPETPACAHAPARRCCRRASMMACSHGCAGFLCPR